MKITVNRAEPTPPPVSSVTLELSIEEAQILKALGGSVCVRGGKLAFDPLSSSVLVKQPFTVDKFLSSIWSALQNQI